MSSAFFEKIEDCVRQGCNFIKTTIDFFVKIFFVKQLVFSTYSENNLWWVLFIDKLQSEHCKNSIIEFSEKFLNFCNQLFFPNIFVCKEANYMKDYVKARQRKKAKKKT